MNKALEVANKVFGKKNYGIINPGYAYNKQFKIVTFVPLEKSDEVAFAMASAGAGVIGNYTVCSFRIKGVGTFRGGKGSNPVVGSAGKYEMTEEVRLEMICSPGNLNNAIDEMLNIHPYEEPAYDIYPIYIRNKKPFKNTAAIRLNRKVKCRNIIDMFTQSIDSNSLPGMFINTYIDTILINTGGNKFDPAVFIDLEKPFLFISISSKKNKYDIIEQG